MSSWNSCDFSGALEAQDSSFQIPQSGVMWYRKDGCRAMSSSDKRGGLPYRPLGELEIDESGGLSCASWTAVHRHRKGNSHSDNGEAVELEVEVDDTPSSSWSPELHPSCGSVDNKQDEEQRARDRMLGLAAKCARIKQARERDRKVAMAKNEAQLRLLQYARKTGYPYNPFDQKKGADADTVAALPKSDNRPKSRSPPPDRSQPRPKPSQAKKYRNEVAAKNQQSWANTCYKVSRKNKKVLRHLYNLRAVVVVCEISLIMVLYIHTASHPSADLLLHLVLQFCILQVRPKAPLAEPAAPKEEAEPPFFVRGCLLTVISLLRSHGKLKTHDSWVHEGRAVLRHLWAPIESS